MKTILSVRVEVRFDSLLENKDRRKLKRRIKKEMIERINSMARELGYKVIKDDA